MKTKVATASVSSNIFHRDCISNQRTLFQIQSLQSVSRPSHFIYMYAFRKYLSRLEITCIDN